MSFLLSWLLVKPNTVRRTCVQFFFIHFTINRLLFWFSVSYRISTLNHCVYLWIRHNKRQLIDEIRLTSSPRQDTITYYRLYLGIIDNELVLWALSRGRGDHLAEPDIFYLCSIDIKFLTFVEQVTEFLN